jgi:small conductance mechanosensitive channel
MLLLLRPIRVREKISLPGSAGITGTVREVGLFRTALVADDGEFISVPNAMIFSAAIINESREPTRRINFTFSVDKNANIGRVQNIVREILHKDSRILKNPLPDALVESITDTGITLVVQAWVLNPNFTAAKSDIKKAVREALVAAKIPLPQQALVLSGTLQQGSVAEDADAQRRQRSA